MKLLALVIVFLGATARAQAPAATSDNVDIAKAHFNTGQAYYEHGRFVDAAHEFEEAYRLSGRAPLLYNMGKAYDGASDFADALDAYQRFLDATPRDNPDRDFATKRVELLKTLVGKIAVADAVDGSTVTLDGKPAGTTPLAAPLTVNPGRHQLQLAHEGYATFRTAIDVPVGGTATVAAKQTESVKVVRVADTRAEKPVYKQWWLWTAVGGAVVAAGVITAVVLTTGSNDNSGVPTVQLPQVR
jgi:tetratricopeptide (TPR) repeat protein